MSSPRLVLPLATWWPTDAARSRFRVRVLGRGVAILAARDDRWRALTPDFDRLVELIGAGVPYQVAAERRHDRAPDPARAREALAAGATVFFPQAHQVLPRVARLMVALRAALLGPRRDECSYLFLVDGRGREGMGWHHDGEVDAFWLQLEGRRTVELGPPVPPRTPEELSDEAHPRACRGAPRVPRGAPSAGGFGGRPEPPMSSVALPPGSLLYLPPRTPHRVVCHERSLALTLTWSAARPRARSTDAVARAMTAWDVASGRVEPWPPERSRSLMWTQVPVALGRGTRARRDVTMWTPEGRMRVPAAARDLVARLAPMPALHVARGRRDAGADALLALGVLADEDLPLLVRPEDPATLDGWRFA